ncbi:alternate-type signal peptide domain-containing protein [Cellulomonas wangsupingiae]|uniref:Alternate-type signal peptide domain-containing protein n=1 Tax=Cellulomonas wangsupingiae TaxID=2968085 RepID=A0ABY5K4U3_9CELL|nr:alternate-type signal peptide domain-containing protein [Cellulomonas wangsupingiae]MCC2333733.1 alternate-type signal peptide domain-containing protein [Cellulomonas wangsupingiae]MCM0639448.1 alternate-type signal peptide domain-containing protein [Cellulomonas wangsupingiae]UUI64995.1 alternate-type signal peptide domain-containing protein [Cellulomonas wangsupingiae]
MNKRTKGLVAGGAGAVILLGTAGTFALWSDSDTAPGAVVTGGQLELTAGDTTWTATDISGQTPVPLPGTGNDVQLVAGVELTGTTTITPELAGEYLVAELATPAPENAVPEWLTVTWTLGGEVVGDGDASIKLTPADFSNSSAALDLAVSIRLADDLQTDADGIDLTDPAAYTWDSGDFTVTLTQLPPSQS